jgi:hypothetical protein
MSTKQRVTSGTAASERKNWPIRRFRLGSEPNDDLSAMTTPEERLEMMWALAEEAWTLTGQPFPRYSRSETPVRLVKRTPSSGSQTRIE